MAWAETAAPLAALGYSYEATQGVVSPFKRAYAREGCAVPCAAPVDSSSGRDEAGVKGQSRLHDGVRGGGGGSEATRL